MITYQETTDATYIYRDTTAFSTIRMDRTADTGNLLQIMRDSVVIVGAPAFRSEGKIPESPVGNIEAVSRL
ncbi:hypothetical protein EV216_12614 [Rhodovulum steppense]|uniref:Uncharacterized protein n=1 Tax=Rhodovulum steppense TaxID=540251 RepID=A0A4R1YLN3_9RHOB|nr:hypothetical protein EV216_12614 [Rhodovulum steppense]